MIKIVRETMTERDCYKDKNSDSKYIMTVSVIVTGAVTKTRTVTVTVKIKVIELVAVTKTVTVTPKIIVIVSEAMTG